MMPSNAARRSVRRSTRSQGDERTSFGSLEAEVLVLPGEVAASVGDTDCLVSDDRSIDGRRTGVGERGGSLGVKNRNRRLVDDGVACGAALRFNEGEASSPPGGDGPSCKSRPKRWCSRLSTGKSARTLSTTEQNESRAS